MKKRLISFLLLIFLLPVGCAQKHPSAEQILCALTQNEIGLPAGQIYLASAPPDQAAYLSPELISAMYAGGELPWQLSLCEDYGIFLSSAQHPCEFAVFLCYSRSDTDLLSAMCHARLDALRAHYKGTAYAHYTDSALVVVVGRYVLLLVSCDPENALKVARQVI